MDGSAGLPRVIDLDEAAKLLAMSREGVAALVAAGYLPVAAPGASEFALGDVKALHARMSDDHVTYDVIVDDPDRVDPQALLDALDGRSDEMARRAFDIFQTVFPEAGGWSMNEQARFIDQSRRRFEAILAVTAHGEAVDLASELEQVGAAAAWSRSSLPQLLVVLRISRDLVVQTAVEVAEERGRHWGLALSLLLTRVLPAMDRLTDAVAQGYWEAVVGREEESRQRYESVVEHATDGVYELDLDGCVQYANSALALVLGRRLSELHGARVTDIFTPVDGAGRLEALLSDSTRRLDLSIERPDGVRRELAVFTYPRVLGERIVGFQGIVRDVSAETEIESQKNEFLALITHDLRQPLTAVLGLGVTLEGYASELPVDRLERMGTSIRQQAERMARLADDLDAASRIEAQALMVNLRPTSLRRTVEDALGTIDDATDVRIEVAPEIVVQADPRRLEQVVANLVENAIVHGARPVVVRADTCGDDVIEVTVDDDGRGVDADIRPTLFTRMRTRGDRDGTRGGGLGLVVVRGLVEAMGGRVWYTERVGGGASFHLTLSTPRVFADRRERHD
ncbi:MAG TPA: PAS domain-containing sensor histidine kinase [Acidimicrobiales bacterium]|nr:PAS domain-containing sensor histidine kinase [Acidimicrobiales bacterium]